MGWLTKILKGSSHKGNYRSHYGEDRNRDIEPRRSADNASDFDKDEIECAIALSLSEADEKGKKVMEEDDDDESLHSLEEEEDDDEDDEKVVAKVVEDDDDDDDDANYHAIAKVVEEESRTKAQLEEDEQLARAIQESLSVEESPLPRSINDSGGVAAFPSPYSFFFPTGGYRICAGCNAEIGHGRFLSCMDAVWHPECFRCQACNHPITDHEFSMSGSRPYHKSCYKERHHPKCDVCNNFIPTNSAGLIEYRAHPFWLQKYCPSHERDGTPRCCSCERMESRDTKYLSLDDGRKLCLECLDSAIMDTHECQPLYFEIREFYEGLNMKVEQDVPLLLVERPALNEAMEGEKNGHHHLPETRGLCLSEEQTITTVFRRPRIGPGYRFVDIRTEPYRLSRICEVTAILILFGLPRLLTGSILAHELMHAWLRLQGFSNLSPEVEEGICQVLAHMWLDSEIYSSPASSSSSSSASSSSSSPSSSSSTSSKKGKRSDFEKKLGEFFRHQIESDTSEAYGEGFRIGNKSVQKFGLKRTLDHIRITGTFPL
ncbi:Protein DA1-related 1 [Linum grandiflorum]